MKEKSAPQERFSLSRWSRRKLEASATPAKPTPITPASVPPALVPLAGASPAPVSPTSAPQELPSIESLSFDSDFTAFLRPEVDEKLKRAALKQLFRNPRFNVMDGLDVYIDDYTKADPIEPAVLKQMLERFSAVASSATPEREELSLPGDAPAAIPSAESPSAPPLPVASAEPASPVTEEPPEKPSVPHSPS